MFGPIARRALRDNQMAAIGVGDAPGNAMAEEQTTAAADRFDSDDIVAKLKLRMINHALPFWSAVPAPARPIWDCREFRV
jgi:hypothetical protein